ncbi:TolC family protein [Adhaeribacter radiodurans]|uniref:TolC family protein n=1 Tax=Adhaeribacter radiodurans TaxID=2745197 RepID=A0A7L7L806_9BACT|nr:TolC family protein [Adhaeribacter radiodurans]QMU28928.1 TolC family protein [Adhaeribacter radiodurans]
MKSIFVFLVCLLSTFIFFPGKAQDILNLEDAIRIALEKNYDIKLVSNDLAIDRNNVSRANAGMVPSLGANITNNNNIQTGKQTRQTGLQEFNNVKSSNTSYGADLNWTIFDGFRMFARYEQLKELEKLGDAELKQTILTTLGDVIGTYYQLVNQQQQLRAYDSAIIISRLRVQTAQNRFTIGKAARLEVLNARVDLNTDTTNLVQQQALYRNTQIQLNEILGRDVNIVFGVPNTLLIDNKLALGSLSDLANQQNPALKVALVNKRIAELDLKQVRANRYPSLGVTSGYTFNQSQSALGFATSANNRGFNYGLSASVNIFNGFLQRRNEQNAEILIQNSQLQYEKADLNIKSQLASAYQSYVTSLTLVTLEENNQKIAKQNLNITLDKYRLGSIAPVEFRDAQLNYLNARVRFNNAQYVAKLAEISLKEIAGDLNL